MRGLSTRCTRRDTRSGRASGMTIIEMMAVVVIAALVMTGVALGIGNLTHQKLKSSALSIAAAVRMAYSRAATTGNTVRIIFDIDNRTFWAEEAEGGRVLLSREDEENVDNEVDEEDEEGGDNSGGDLGNLDETDPLASMLGVDPTQLMSAARGAAESNLGDNMDFDMLGQLGAMGSKAVEEMGKAPRYKVPRFASFPGKLGRKNSLEGNVTFASVYTSHRERPAEEGKAALYFFPGGMTELAVIQVQDSGGYINSVEVHPLTGRTRIHDVPYEAPTHEDDLNEAREAF